MRLVVYVFIICVVSLPVYGRTVRVGTYNVGNYLKTDRRVDSGYVKDYPKPEGEKEAVRKVIHLVKADILAIQEMGDEGFLKELQGDLAREGFVYQYAYVMKGEDPERHLAVLSREAFVKVRAHGDLEFRYLGGRMVKVRRGLLEVEFEMGGETWSLFVVHLKSRRTGNVEDYESQKERLGEAVVIRDRIKERHLKGYVIVGDFNDGLRSKTVGRFLKTGKTQLAMVVEAKDSRGEVWTQFRKGHGVYSQFDHVLVSPSFFEKVKGAVIVDAPFGMEGSDHRMVYTDIEI